MSRNTPIRGPPSQGRPDYSSAQFYERSYFVKKMCLCLLLTAALTMSASALEVPTSTVVQNLNGSQQVVKT